MVELNKTTTEQYLAEFLYLKTFGLISLSGCADSKAPAKSTDNNQDPLLIPENHVINSILSTKLYDLASSSAAWAPAVDDFLANANAALTSGEANEYGNYNTSVIANSGTIENTDGTHSEVSFFIMAPTVSNVASGDTGADTGADTAAVAVTAADLSAISADQLIQNGSANLDLAEVSGYTGAYVMVVMVEGYTAEGESTGTSANLVTVLDDGSSVFTELHTYYVNGVKKLKVNVEGSNLPYTHEEFSDIEDDDAQITAHADLFVQVSGLNSEDLAVASDFAVAE